MRRMMQILMVSGLVVAGAVATARAASADGFSDYRRGLNELLPEVSVWHDDVAALMQATSTKPEVACSAEMTQAAALGRSIAADLAGTGLLAPAAIKGQHDELTNATRLIAQAARMACANSGTARVVVAGQADRFDSAQAQLRAFVTGLHIERPGLVPVTTGTGN
jgi:hypothetical protein